VEGLYTINMTPQDYYSNNGSNISVQYDLNIIPTKDAIDIDTELPFYSPTDSIYLNASFNVPATDTLGDCQVVLRNASGNESVLTNFSATGDYCYNDSIALSGVRNGIYKIFVRMTENTEGDIIESETAGIYVCNQTDNGTCMFADFNNNSYADVCDEDVNNVANCTNINVSGIWYLSGNISDSSTDYCINISADNVTLDGQGYEIDGDDNAVYGIWIDRASSYDANITIKNVIVRDWAQAGIYNRNAQNITIANVTATSNNGDGLHIYADYARIRNVTVFGNNDGIELYYSQHHNITDSNITGNNFNIEYNTDNTECDSVLENVTGEDGLPILLFNRTVDIVDWYDNFSDIIICGGDDSRIENVTRIMDSHHSVPIQVRYSSRVNISDIRVNYTYTPVFMTGAEHAKVEDVEIYNSYNGIYSWNASDDTVIRDSYIFNSSNVGLWIWGDRNNVTNVTLDECETGIELYYTEDSIINNSVILDSSNRGILIRETNRTKIYNNLLNNTDNVEFIGTILESFWNTTEQTGSRIIGQGTDIAGNFWANPLGTGYSENCPDTDKNGFCDMAYNVTTDSGCTAGADCGNNTDYRPLSGDYDNYYLQGCANITAPGTYYLAQNISDSSVSYCMNISANDVTLNCQWNEIDGDDNSVFGIYVSRDASTVSNVNVVNCTVSDWDRAGILFSNASRNTISYTSISSNDDSGLLLNYSSNNSVEGCDASDNSNGIEMNYADKNNISNSSGQSNSYMIYMTDSSDNAIRDSYFNGSFGEIVASSCSDLTIDNVDTKDSNNAWSFSSCSDVTIEDCSIVEHAIGLMLTNSYNVVVNNTLIANSSSQDVMVSNLLEAQCDNVFENVTGSGGGEIGYYNYSATIGNRSFAQLILCDADNSNLTNITVNGSPDRFNNNMIIYMTQSATIEELESSGNLEGLYISGSESLIIRNATLDDNNQYGAYSTGSYSNRYSGIESSGNDYGIYLLNSYGNEFIDSNLSLNNYSICLNSMSHLPSNHRTCSHMNCLSGISNNC
jgi:parallel beta-helix repeat protein